MPSPTSPRWPRSSGRSSGAGGAGVPLLCEHRRQELRALRLQRAPGRHRPARRELLPRGEVRRDPGEVRRLPRAPARARGAPRRHRHRRARHGPGDAAGRGALEARGHTRGPQDLQPDSGRRAQGAAPQLRLRHLGRRTRRWHRDPHRDGGAAAVVPLPPRDGADRDLHRGLAGPSCPSAPSARPRPISPPTSSRRTSTSTAARSPALPSCGRAGSAAWPSSRDASARPWGGSTSPATFRHARRRRWTSSWPT